MSKEERKNQFFSEVDENLMILLDSDSFETLDKKKSDLLTQCQLSCDLVRQNHYAMNAATISLLYKITDTDYSSPIPQEEITILGVNGHSYELLEQIALKNGLQIPEKVTESIAQADVFEDDYGGTMLRRQLDQNKAIYGLTRALCQKFRESLDFSEEELGTYSHTGAMHHAEMIYRDGFSQLPSEAQSKYFTMATAILLQHTIPLMFSEGS